MNSAISFIKALLFGPGILLVTILGSVYGPSTLSLPVMEVWKHTYVCTNVHMNLQIYTHVNIGIPKSRIILTVYVCMYVFTDTMYVYNVIMIIIRKQMCIIINVIEEHVCV